MDELLTKIWETDKKVLFLREKLPDFQRSDVAIVNCREIYDAVKTGFFKFDEDGQPKINVCSEFSHDISSLSSLLRHEMVHVYDFKIKRLDLTNNDKTDLIKSEVRAYSYSGYCDEFIWHKKISFLRKRCLQKAVENSVFYHSVTKNEKVMLIKTIELVVANEANLMKDLSK